MATRTDSTRGRSETVRADKVGWTHFDLVERAFAGNKIVVRRSALGEIVRGGEWIEGGEESLTNRLGVILRIDTALYSLVRYEVHTVAKVSYDRSSFTKEQRRMAGYELPVSEDRPAA